jgi:hypothetical protein
LISAFSRSKLFDIDVPDGVLDPVLVGECIGDSLIGDDVISPALTFAFSFPVIASEMARSPVPFDFLLKNERL